MSFPIHLADRLTRVGTRQRPHSLRLLTDRVFAAEDHSQLLLSNISIPRPASAPILEARPLRLILPKPATKYGIRPVRLKALRLHGRYMGCIRQLKPRRRAKIKAIRAKKEGRAAIARARTFPQ